MQEKDNKWPYNLLQIESKEYPGHKSGIAGILEALNMGFAG